MKKIYDNKKVKVIVGILLFLLCLLYFIGKEETKEEEISLNTISQVKEITTKENESFYADIKGYVKNPGVYEIKETSTIEDIIGLAGGLKKGAYTDNINLSKKVKDEMVIYIFEEDYIKRLESLNKCVCKNLYKYIDCPKGIETTTTSTTRKENTLDTTTNIKTTSTKNFITSNFITKTTNINEPTTTKKITTKKIISTTTEKITTKKIIPNTSVSTTTKSLELININTADVETLCTIKGLGEKKAEAIIEYRNEVGLFKSIDEIMNVSGIGVATFEKIKDYITI